MLTSSAALGVPLDDVGVRATLAIAVGGFALAALLGAGRPLPSGTRMAGTALVALAGVVTVGVALQSVVLGGTPLPGEDWAEYLLYAQEIAREQSLLIDNPYWMLERQSFPLDPGAPSLYGAALVLGNGSATSLLHGIWLFAVLAILAVFVFTTALWGSTAGLVAAAAYAVVPMNLNMLAWHGLPNVFAFCLLPLGLAAAGAVLRGHGTRRWAVVLAVALVALAGAHRFSFVLGVIAIGVALSIAVVRLPRETMRFVGWTALAAAVAGIGVAIDLVRRNGALGGTQGYEAFLPTRIDWGLVARDVTWPIAIAGIMSLAFVLGARRFRQDAGRLVLIGPVVAIVALTYAWIAHVPTAYNRAAFFAPLALAPSIGLVASRLKPSLLVPVAAVLVALTAVDTRSLAADYRGFYGHVNAASLRGLGLALERTEPGDAVVTDQCWGFLSTWLLQRPVLAALDPALILPRREVAPAARAHRILYGDDGEALARQSRIRLALVDPQCTYQSGDPYPLPRLGRLVYASTRLLVYEVPRVAAAS